MIVPSGYNNPSGVGKIWVLDAKTGEVLTTLSTGFGSSTSPSGLAQIAGFTQDYHNYMTDEVYGGDQYGNVWRFDLRDPDATKWSVALFAKLTDPDGNTQPVTTAPQIEIDIANGADRWVFVGTGRLLDTSDLDDPQIQTFYALRDGTQKTPSAITTGSPIIRSDLVAVTDATGTGGITAHGWYDDLVQFSRVVTPFQAVLSTVVYSATKPQTDPCLTGQSADVFVRSFAEGVSQIDDTAATGTGITCTAEFCDSEGGAVDAQIIGTTSDGSPHGQPRGRDHARHDGQAGHDPDQAAEMELHAPPVVADTLRVARQLWFNHGRAAQPAARPSILARPLPRFVVNATATLRIEPYGPGARMPLSIAASVAIHIAVLVAIGVLLQAMPATVVKHDRGLPSLSADIIALPALSEEPRPLLPPLAPAEPIHQMLPLPLAPPSRMTPAPGLSSAPATIQVNAELAAGRQDLVRLQQRCEAVRRRPRAADGIALSAAARARAAGRGQPCRAVPGEGRGPGPLIDAFGAVVDRCGGSRRRSARAPR